MFTISSPSSYSKLKNLSRVSNIRHYFIQLINDGYHFTNGFECSDVHIFGKLNNLSRNIFELSFYLDQSTWKHKVIPNEVSKNESNRVVDLLFYKNHFVPCKKFYVFLGNHICKHFCERCLISCASQNIIIKHKGKCEQKQEITTIRNSSEPNLYWKKHFQKNPLFFRIYADIEADNEIDNSYLGKETTNVYKQITLCNGYYLVSELDDVLKSGYYDPYLDYDNVDWFVDEFCRLQNKIAFYFKKTKKDILMTEEDGEYCKNDKICQFCEKETISGKVRDHCCLIGKVQRTSS